MSLETIDGVEELQKDDQDLMQDGDKRLNIHLPTKQISTSSYGSRRSSLSGLGPTNSLKVQEKVKKI